MKEAEAWSEEEVGRFLAAAADHRWAVGFRLAVLYGLRRSELLALRWDDIDTDAGQVRIDEGLVPVTGGVVWTKAKNTNSRRTIPVDETTVAGLVRHRRQQAAERLAAGPDWHDEDMVLATRTGNAVLPRSYDRTLDVLEKQAGVPRLSSHGLRHTAATHMVSNAKDLGELRAVASILGHSPEILLRIYAHAVPQVVQAVADGIGARAPAVAPADPSS